MADKPSFEAKVRALMIIIAAAKRLERERRAAATLEDDSANSLRLREEDAERAAPV